jgi:enamine deaminase RidA (YjgF/YER057c/UK114 family)
MSTAELKLEYVPRDQIAGRPAPWWSNVLGVVGFSSLPVLIESDIPVAASMTPSLGFAAGTLCEVWRVERAVDAGSSPEEPPSPRGSWRHGRVHYRFCDEFLFGSLSLEETEVDLSQATRMAYRSIFEVLERTGHRHLIRVWNYLPEITRESGGEERYRRFNSARQAAFRSVGRPVEGSVPAACALGSPAGSPISIYFIAGREPPMTIENPRQVSAYRYPPKFGTHTPSFSRACVLRQAAGTNLFVSGTASIVGCETIHHGDVRAQTRETLANLDALLQEANRVVGARRYTLDALKFKVYVREPRDLEAIQSALSASLRPPAPILYLQADVCRRELLVEIEATGESLAA